MWKTLIAYPLVVATGLAIGSGEWTIPTLLTGLTLGVASALLFEGVTRLLSKKWGGPS